MPGFEARTDSGDGQPLRAQGWLWVRESIEERGCTLVLLPPYSPDFNPIEGAFSKIKTLLKKAKARTQEALFEATHHALRAISAKDARGFFGHCGYTSLQAQSI